MDSGGTSVLWTGRALGILGYGTKVEKSVTEKVNFVSTVKISNS